MRCPLSVSRASASSTPTVRVTSFTAPSLFLPEQSGPELGRTFQLRARGIGPQDFSGSATKPACRRWPTSPACGENSTWTHNQFENSGQRPLEIESRIGGLLRRDRTVRGENTAAEDVIRPAIDGLDSDQPTGLEAERRERSLFGVTPHDDLIVTGGQARDLQLVRALIAPEPRQAVIALCIAGQPRRHA